MTKSKKNYTEDFKKDAINLVLKSPSVKYAADSLGIPESTLATWVKNATNATQINSEVIDINIEIKKLRKENARLREEKEILKKAATFFARESK